MSDKRSSPLGTTSKRRYVWVWADLRVFGECSISLHVAELQVGLRLVVLVSSVVLRMLLSESSFLKLCWILCPQGKQ